MLYSGVPVSSWSSLIEFNLPGLGLQYRPHVLPRVFENDDGLLKGIALEHDSIKASLSSAQSYKWDDILDPVTPPKERDTQLTDLLGLPLRGEMFPHVYARSTCK